jgi:hypothetical protein
MQVSGSFLHLDKSIEQASAPYVHRALVQRAGSADHSPDPGAVFPPVNGGLHCRSIGSHFSPALPSVFPPVSGGLHCGNHSSVCSTGISREVFPPVKGGLHLSAARDNVSAQVRRPGFSEPCSRR